MAVESASTCCKYLMHSPRVCITVYLGSGTTAPFPWRRRAMFLSCGKGKATSGAALAMAGSFSFVDPRHLDGLEDLFAAAPGVVVEARKGEHPVVEIGEANALRVDARMRFQQCYGDVLGVGPLHALLPPPSRS